MEVSITRNEVEINGLTTLMDEREEGPISFANDSANIVQAENVSGKFEESKAEVGNNNESLLRATPSSDSAGSLASNFLPLLPEPTSDKERLARKRIEEEKYDVEAWALVLAESQARPAGKAANPLWEHALAIFPSSGRLWLAYVEERMAAGDDDGVKSLFSRCLRECPYLDLWRAYLRFIRRGTADSSAEGHEEIRQAFEFTLDHVGLDIGAASVWGEYIAYLKALPAGNKQETSARMTAVRHAYQRAVLVPMHGVEQLWKDYEAFENTISRALAKGLLAEYQARQQATRAVLHERRRLWERLDLSALPTPPGMYPQIEERCCRAWRELLTLERGNPQRLGPPQLAASVSFVYNQCLMYLRHYPDIWYDYAMWHAANSSTEAAAIVFQRALKALPDCEVLYFAYAEMEETSGRIQEAKGIYESLLRAQGGGSSLAHIQKMRFARRTEGVDAARKAFLAGCRAASCTHHVFVASALLELCMDKDPKVSRNVFELGLKRFITQTDYVLEYAQFLRGVNDERNVRALFERVLTVLPASEAHEVWSCYIDCERAYGDLPSLLKVEQRRRDALAQENSTEASTCQLHEVAARYSFGDLWPCAPSQLAHMALLQTPDRGAGKVPCGAAPPVSTNRVLSHPKLAGIGSGSAEKAAPHGGAAAQILRPDTTQMAIYDPRQGLRMVVPPPGVGHSGRVGAASATPSSLGLPARAPASLPGGWTPAEIPAVDETTLRGLPPLIANFLCQMPAVPGPYPDVDFFISGLLQMDNGFEGPFQGVIPPFQPSPDVETTRPPGTPPEAPPVTRGPLQVTAAKRKDSDRDEDVTGAALPRPPQRDIFRMRHLYKARGTSVVTGGGAHSGGTLSGEFPSGSST